MSFGVSKISKKSITSPLTLSAKIGEIKINSTDNRPYIFFQDAWHPLLLATDIPMCIRESNNNIHISAKRGDIHDGQICFDIDTETKAKITEYGDIILPQGSIIESGEIVECDGDCHTTTNNFVIKHYLTTSSASAKCFNPNVKQDSWINVSPIVENSNIIPHIWVSNVQNGSFEYNILLDVIRSNEISENNTEQNVEKIMVKLCIQLKNLIL